MMRTSVADPARANGFTLIELLIVVTIIGLMSAVVVLAVPGDGAELRADADRFAARARAAQELAVLEGRPIVLLVDAAGYGFERRSGSEWQASADPRLGVQNWSEGTRAGTEQARITFDPTGLSEPAEIPLIRGEQVLTVAVEGNGRIHVRAAS